ncbi:glycosyltransferase [Atlantibacter hermannii]|uniref:glycosyltransferase n=1 Tax=Atlantibacter hermannii TaxID=565 RepID=UPI0019337FE8|nr:glycosyltransferase [Atlantibacter hermannii]MBL7638150.1 glycosyltransferase [Atlantibacter hermannii]MBL7675339.1 glycosyltransferase [Atlantibacter hermannii]MCZ7834544.1 glycosyltransferase [Atlantibacter hermannii]
MKIDYVITGMDTGGAEAQVVSLLLELNKRGHNVRLISLTPPVDLTLPLLSNNIPVISLGMKSKLSLPLAAVKLIKLLRKQPPDILHGHMFHANILVRLVRLFIGNVSVVCTAHSVREGGAIRDWTYRLTNTLCEMNTVVSDAAYKRFVDDNVFPAKKTQTIYNCVDTDYFTPAERVANKPFRWIAVGRLVKVKNHLLLLKAMKKLPDSQLIIVGEGDQRANLQSFIDSNGLSERAFLHGKKENVVDYYRNADGFVLSSDYEGFALVVAEAMSCGLPVVATRCGGPVEIIGSDETIGKLVSTNNEQEMAEAMHSIESMKFETRSLKGKMSRSRIIDLFSIHKIVSTWEEIYQALQKRRSYK